MFGLEFEQNAAKIRRLWLEMTVLGRKLGRLG